MNCPPSGGRINRLPSVGKMSCPLNVRNMSYPPSGGKMNRLPSGGKMSRPFNVGI